MGIGVGIWKTQPSLPAAAPRAKRPACTWLVVGQPTCAALIGGSIFLTGFSGIGAPGKKLGKEYRIKQSSSQDGRYENCFAANLVKPSQHWSLWCRRFAL